MPGGPPPVVRARPPQAGRPCTQLCSPILPVLSGAVPTHAALGPHSSCLEETHAADPACGAPKGGLKGDKLQPLFGRGVLSRGLSRKGSPGG